MHVKPVIDDCYGCVLASNTLSPNGGNVDVVTKLDSIEKMPLFTEDGVLDIEVVGKFCLSLDSRSIRLGVLATEQARVPAYDVVVQSWWEAALHMPHARLLLSREKHRVEDVCTAGITLPPLPLGLDDVDFDLGRAEHMMIREVAELTLVCKTKTKSNLAWVDSRIDVKNVEIVLVVIALPSRAHRSQ